MLGVIARGVVSRQPIQSFMSSTAKNNTLGREVLPVVSDWANNGVAERTAKNKIKLVRATPLA